MRLLFWISILISVCSPLLLSADSELNVLEDSPFIRPLSAVFDKKWNGLQFETDLQETELKFLRDHAKDYVLYKKGQLPIGAAALTPEQCVEGQPLRNTFCDYISEDWKQTVRKAKLEAESPDPDKTSPISKAELEQITVSLRNSDLGSLEEVSGVHLRRAIRGLGTPEEVAALTRKVLDERKCPPINVLVTLGLRHEEHFPNHQHMDLAMEAFERADRCSPLGDLEGARARYRLGLIQMLESGCSKAEQTFKRLLEYRADETFMSRAFYWVGRCSLETGHRLKAEIYQNRIAKWNPLGFHTLQLNQHNRRSPVNSFVITDEPNVWMRSKRMPELNPVVRAVEALQETRYPGASMELLSYLKAKSIGSEPEFQLYLGLLCNRAEDFIGKFQLMSRVFKQDPRLISVSSLKVFYPSNYLQNLKLLQPKSDPLLLLSLIRQESGFNTGAISGAGAMGLMQLMPATARRMGMRNRRSLLRADTNLQLGVRYFEILRNRFKGDTDLALAAYNAGPERVDDWLKRYPTQDRVLFMDLMPFNETRNYVALINRNYHWYQQLYGAPQMMRLAALKREAQRFPASVRKFGRSPKKPRH